MTTVEMQDLAGIAIGECPPNLVSLGLINVLGKVRFRFRHAATSAAKRQT
jgi:hypothetical protein